MILCECSSVLFISVSYFLGRAKTCLLNIVSPAVFLCSGAEDPVILLSESGEYDDTVEVDGTSTYVGVWGDHADGTVSVEIE